MSHSRRWIDLPLLLVAAVALGTSGCEETDSPLVPHDPLAQLSGSPDGAPERPVFHPASDRYSDTGKPGATGRVGSATVTARALFGKDGVTTLEVTTGTLDSEETPPGNLKKLQIKGIVDPDEDPLFVQNHNNLRDGGYAVFELEHLLPGTTAQVQATVAGIDRNRVGVATLPEIVKLRPDLEVGLTAPEVAYASQPVQIAATVSERNGDVGATADCILYVDGAEADRAAGIWVDRASVVSCEFSHTFEETGTHDLLVAAEDVRPGDWDLANNVAHGSIEIRPLGAPLRGWVSAGQYVMDNKTTYGYQGIFPEFFRGTHAVTHHQELGGVGRPPPGERLPKSGTLQMIEEGDGVIVRSTTLQVVPHWAGTCGVGWMDGASTVVCPWQMSYNRRAGHVTYFSISHAEWTGSEVTVYAENFSREEAYGGPMVHWGSQLTVRVTLDGNDGTRFVASPTLTLNPYRNEREGAGCPQSWYCWAVEEVEEGVRGWTSY